MGDFVFSDPVGDTVYVTGYTDPDVASLVIPTVYVDGDTTYSVVGISSEAFSNFASLVNITIPGVVSNIGDRAFTGCTSLDNLTIPSSVTNIGVNAFSNCTSLTTADLTGVQATIGRLVFQDDLLLASVTLSGMTNIGWGMFYNTGLTDVTIPASVINISYGAFANCSNLVSADLTGVSATIEGSVFAGNLSLASVTLSDMTNIGVGMFYESGLTDVTIPASVSNIGNAAFGRCSNLSNADLTGVQASIGSNVFSNGVALSSVTLTDMTSIGVNMFFNTGLTSVTVPATVTNIGDNAFAGCTQLSNADLTGVRASIGSNVFANDVSLASVTLTGMSIIGLNMFSNTGLTSVTIPYSLENMGDTAFAECTKLSNADLTGVQATIGIAVFANDVLLASVDLGDMLIIGLNMFSNTGLTSVTIPASVTNIGEFAFTACTRLESADLTGVDATIGSNVFENDVSLASVTLTGMTTIGVNMFAGTGLTDVTIPASVSNIGDGAFSNCTKLSNANLTGVSAEIGGDVFAYNLSLTTVTLSEMKNIGAYMFYTTGLTSVTIPSSVTNIGTYAFSQCAKLSNAVLTGVNATIGTNMFYNDLSLASVTLTGMTNIGVNMFYQTGLSGTVTIPSSLTSIGDSAFQECLDITTVIFTNGLTLIGDYMFSNCANLTTANVPSSVRSLGIDWYAGTQISAPSSIPDGTTYIADNLFYNRTDLTSMPIPGTVITIGANAFYGCTGLTSMTFPPSVQNISAGAFQGCTGITTILFPENTMSIGNDAFNGVPLNPIRFSGNSAPAIGTQAFDGAATNVFTVQGYRGWPKYIDT